MTTKKEVTGRALGGIARSMKLTAEQRSEIARKAANTRHALKKPLQATHMGNFEEEFGIDVDCYVLNDERKTGVISKRGMALALGFKGESGSRLTAFIKGKVISEYAGQELIEKIENPIVFQGVMPGATSMARSETHGYDVTILIDLCKAIIKAETDGKLHSQQLSLATQAHVIVAASAKAGIQGLVYALSGYDRTKEEVISAFKAFVQAEAKKYESEFPTELYMEWARLYGHRPQRSWKDMHLTLNHVYYPLAKSDGKLLTLLREAKSSSGDRNAKLFQFLNLVGAKALRFQLGRIYDVAQSARTSAIYEKEVARRFGSQQQLDLDE